MLTGFELSLFAGLHYLQYCLTRCKSRTKVSFVCLHWEALLPAVDLLTSPCFLSRMYHCPELPSVLMLISHCLLLFSTQMEEGLEMGGGVELQVVLCSFFDASYSAIL